MTRYGFVLSSDGSKSSFEIGAWKALRELNFDITAVTGSFVGALNAALIAQGDFERAVRFWRNVSSKSLLGVNRHIAQRYTEEWSRTDTKAFKKNYMMYVNGRTEELDPLRDVIELFIDEKLVRKSKTDFGFVSISLQTLEAELITLKKIPNGKLCQYLLAAACFPQITQTNRAADPQFSSQYSPYSLAEKLRCDSIISTDDVIVIHPGIKSDVSIIKSSEVLELNVSETAEQMKKNIKMGYIDTLMMFEESYGNSYFIPEMAPSERFNYFKAKLGSPINYQLDSLVRMILRLKEFNKANVETRLKQMLKAGGVKYDNIHLALLENAAAIIGLPINERYTPDKLLNALTKGISQKITDSKSAFTDIAFVKKLIAAASDPGNSYPNPVLFSQYFLLFLSSKPESYRKLAPLLTNMNIKTLAAFVTFVYILYA